MKRPFVIAAATVGVLATAGFALPNLPPNALTQTVHDRLFQEKERSFASAADAHGRGDGAFALPEWIPEDAKNVKVKVRTSGEGKLIRFTLGRTPLEAPHCAARPKPVGAPELAAKWWPSDARHDGRAECRDALQYQVVVKGRRVYAWTNGDASPDAPPGAKFRG
ncbi:hypothetical protein [Streptomyces sp. NPDC090022]|uniref:hypothetical protein n=1 Tax=Streptomyces sp. NPDC090022 TaxID=3365920 RepID=UPI00381A2D14